MEQYGDIFTSPTGVRLHCHVKHPIDLTLGAPLPKALIYRCSILENDEIKRQIQALLHKGHIQPSSSPCGSPIIYFCEIIVLNYLLFCEQCNLLIVSRFIKKIQIDFSMNDDNLYINWFLRVFVLCRALERKIKTSFFVFLILLG